MLHRPCINSMCTLCFTDPVLTMLHRPCINSQVYSMLHRPCINSQCTLCYIEPVLTGMRKMCSEWKQRCGNPVQNIKQENISARIKNVLRLIIFGWESKSKMYNRIRMD